MIKRILSIFFVIAMVLNVASCGNTQKAAVNTTLPLGESDFAYMVIYGLDEADALSESVSALALSVRKNLKKNVKSKEDNKVKYKKGSPEILIGNTNRPESQQAMEMLKSNRKTHANDSIVAVIDNKIVINSPNMDVIVETVKWFGDTFLKDETAWSMLTANYKYIYEYEYVSDWRIGDNSITDYSIVMRSDSSAVYGIYAQELQSLIKEKTCYSIELLNDKTDATEYEILIGKSARAETKVKLKKDQYSIFVKGNKLVAVGYNDQATAYATKKLIELFSGENGGVIPADYSVTKVFKPSKNDYELVWSDEFSTFNSDFWSRYNYPNSKNAAGGIDYPSTDYVSIRNGMAVLTSKLDPKTKDSYSGVLGSDKQHYWKFGIFEMRAKWAGDTSCHAFWLQSPQGQEMPFYNEAGILLEVDILENFGFQNSFASNLHFWWKDKANNWQRHVSLDGTQFSEAKRFKLPEGENFSDDFHTFTYVWSPEKVQFAVDGKVFFTYDITKDWDGHGVEPYFHPICSVRTSNYLFKDASYAKNVWQEGGPTKNEFYIDYMRLYQRDVDGGYSKLFK